MFGGGGFLASIIQLGGAKTSVYCINMGGQRTVFYSENPFLYPKDTPSTVAKMTSQKQFSE